MQKKSSGMTRDSMHVLEGLSQQLSDASLTFYICDIASKLTVVLTAVAVSSSFVAAAASLEDCKTIKVVRRVGQEATLIYRALAPRLMQAQVRTLRVTLGVEGIWSPEMGAMGAAPASPDTMRASDGAATASSSASWDTKEFSGMLSALWDA